MAKNLLYRIFGLRKLSAGLRRRFQREGIVFDEEGTSCALGFRNFRGPRNASTRGWEGAHAGTLIVTKQTFYVQLPYMLVADNAITTSADYFTLELKSEKELVMKFEEANFLFEGANGELTCLWRTDTASSIYAYFKDLKNQPPDKSLEPDA